MINPARNNRFGSSIDTGEIVAIIPLSNNKNAIISPLDLGKIMDNNWYASKRKTKYKTEFVATRSLRYRLNGQPKVKKIYMARKIMGEPKDFQIDHINGQTLDNRRSNLKMVTNRQNSQNRHDDRTSKYAGVTWNKSRQKWRSKIGIGKNVVHLGCFESEISAAEEYVRACDEFEKTGKLTRIHVRKKTSKYKGVCWNKRLGKWHVRIPINGKRKHLGYFKSEKEAAEAYQKALNDVKKV